jgi:hypothetical protein
MIARIRFTRQRALQEVKRARVVLNAALDRDYRPELTRLQQAYDDAKIKFRARADLIPQHLTTEQVHEIRADIKRTIDDFAITAEDSARLLENRAVGFGYETGIRNLAAGGLSVGVNPTVLSNVRAAVHYVDSAGFQNVLRKMGVYHADVIANRLLQGITEGRSPLWSAAQIRGYLVDSPNPLYDAVRLSRTTQLYSARRATIEAYSSEGVDSWIWSAELGVNTCISCICLHGTVHSVNETLNDHHNGKCAAVPVTPSWRSLGFIDGDDVAIENGADWFAQQNESYQRGKLSGDAYDLYQEGVLKITPRIVSSTYDNEVFGTMRREATQQEMIDRALHQ